MLIERKVILHLLLEELNVKYGQSNTILSRFKKYKDVNGEGCYVNSKDLYAYLQKRIDKSKKEEQKCSQTISKLRDLEIMKGGEIE